MKTILLLLLVFTTSVSCDKDDDDNDTKQPETNETFTMPEESVPHEGTWLQWPHHYNSGHDYRTSLDPIWVAMSKEIVTSENLHIVAYDQTEKDRIMSLLTKDGIETTKVDFLIQKTDDVWVRDNGPIYVRDKDNRLVIQDWGFNGWGGKTEYNNCNIIPIKIGELQNRRVIDINKTMINEGGSVEIDGHGTFMACKSSILNANRNPNMTQEQAEAHFTKYLGVTNFIWLKGQAGLDITDQHIDGFARFANSKTIVTMVEADLQDFQVLDSDIKILYAAKNKSGEAYDLKKIPLTKENVVTTKGKNLGYKGSYINYYIANKKILVPNYSDENDAVANALIQELYPNRTVVGIDVRDLYEHGGMVHCVTQQQPYE